ncbi:MULTISPECIES: LapA family protein [unclassified Coleofasciculus]|uniref:LapA family protein n=1 Tax=unclassified Coleofasciculus TaxID=2692782 RepID=UPI00187DFBF1|nr:MULTISPECIES: LapA family protein [unclassified Coleofasciculus]MBE9128926.1 LapA family protein [Coleofasciculus sp. LEGE 07081]MBE9150394.1 LapA family protein [Coleofasciculus sp. LEGE 07092]
MLRLFLILAGIIAISAIIFALQNAVPITISVWFWQLEGSLALVLVLTLVVGILVGLLVSMPAIIKRSWKIASHQKKITRLEKASSEQAQQITNQQKRIEYLEHSLILNSEESSEPEPNV